MLETRIEILEPSNNCIEVSSQNEQNFTNYNIDNPSEHLRPIKEVTRIVARKKLKLSNGKDSSEASPKALIKIGRKGSDKLFKIKDNKPNSLNHSELENSDPDKFFENFDKLFAVTNDSTNTITDETGYPKIKNIRRILLDDFSIAPSRTYSCEPNDSFTQERFSAKSVTNKERILPQLDNVSHRPWHNLKFDYQVPEIQPSTKCNNRNTIVDMANLEFQSRLDKDKLPDLKLPKTFVNKPSVFSKVSNEGSEKTERIIDKINKFHEKFIIKNTTNLNIPSKTPVNADALAGGVRPRQQPLQNILKPKKVDTNQRFSVMPEETKEQGTRSNQNDELRLRVNSVQTIDNSFKKNGAQRNDLSLDIGDGSKVKFMLKNLEQRTANYYQGILNKIQNNAKDPKNIYGTSRSHYSKENLGILANSSRDKQQEVSQTRNLKEEIQPIVKNTEILVQTKKNSGQTSRVKLGDISHLYKGPRQNVKIKDSLITTKNARKGAAGLDPIKEVYSTNIEARASSVPRR